MKKSDNVLMESLSIELYGRKYEWRKLCKKGVNTAIDGKRARLKLTPGQAKQYMELKIKAKQERAKKEEDSANK